ncbi:MAG: hypothetical protein LM575_08085, partial [Caldimicrobium sp.]|nr:hypothetical protein [Caldimicrobium sp.]
NIENFLSYLEKFREFIANNPPSFENVQLLYTFSAGVELELKEILEEMLKSADFKLYKSKSLGKNQILINETILWIFSPFFISKNLDLSKN